MHLSTARSGRSHQTHHRLRTALLRVMLALAAVVAGLVGTAGTAKAAGIQCSHSWHYIIFGQTGRTVKPVTDETGTFLQAVGNRNQDPWNQQVLFCRDPLWGANQYAIFTNLGSAYWNNEWYSRIPLYTVGSISSPNQLFQIDDFDGNFFTLLSVTDNWQAPGYVYADQNKGYKLFANNGYSKTGINLFQISPRALMA